MLSNANRILGVEELPAPVGFRALAFEEKPLPEVVDFTGMEDLILQLARHHRGLAVLHLADLECAAVTLGIDARVVERARQVLATPDGRAQLIAAVRCAHDEIHAAPCRNAPELPCPPRTASALVRAATRHPLGLDFLRRGYLESVAVVFHVHPNRVLRARALLERCDVRRVRRPGD
jgi:hypothetical protein